MEVEQAEKLDPPPPLEALLSAKVDALGARARFDEAIKAIDSARVSEPLKLWLKLRLVLIRRREKPPGVDRKAFDAEAFGIAEKFRGVNAAEARRGMMDLARTIDEPAADAPPEWWDLLAEGHLRLGDPVRAGRLEGKGADRAEATGHPEMAASLRYKAGAYLFEAGKFAEADRRLTQAIDQAQAPRDLKGPGRDAPRARPGAGRRDPGGPGLPVVLPRGARGPGPRLPARTIDGRSPLAPRAGPRLLREAGRGPPALVGHPPRPPPMGRGPDLDR